MVLCRDPVDLQLEAPQIDPFLQRCTYSQSEHHRTDRKSADNTCALHLNAPCELNTEPIELNQPARPSWMNWLFPSSKWKGVPFYCFS